MSMSSIPNTLTILINTPIRGSSKLIYKPVMTVPLEKKDRKQGENVLFTPLIKLDTAVIDTIPPNYPKSELFTQFFDNSEFNSLINRTLGKKMQKIRTLEEATDEGIVDNNIRLTLDTLFKENNSFFVKDHEYLINNYSWATGDWKLDTKKFMQNFARTYNAYGANTNSLYYQRMNEEHASDQLKKLDDSVKHGKISTSVSKFKDSLISDDRGSGLGTGTGTDTWTKKSIPTVAPPPTISNNILTNRKLIKRVSPSMRTLFGSIINKPFIKTNDDRSFSCDSLTQTVIFADDNNFVQLISESGESSGLRSSYDEYTKSVDDYNLILNEYQLFMGIAVDPDSNVNYNSFTKYYEYGSVIRDMVDQDQDDKDKDKLRDQDFTINIGKINMYKKFFAKTAIMLIMILGKLLIFKRKIFRNFYIFLVMMRKYLFDNKTELYKLAFYQKYATLIKQNTTKITGILDDEIFMIIDFDMRYYKAIADNCFDELSNFKAEVDFFKKSLTPVLQTNPSYTVQKEKYTRYPSLLMAERSFFAIFFFKILKMGQTNDCKIWKLSTSLTKEFLSGIIKITSEQIIHSNSIYEKYNSGYTESQRNDLAQLLKDKSKSSVFSFGRWAKQKTDFYNLEKNVWLSHFCILLSTEISFIHLDRKLSCVSSFIDMIHYYKYFFKWGYQNYFTFVEKLQTEGFDFSSSFIKCLIINDTGLVITPTEVDNKMRQVQTQMDRCDVLLKQKYNALTDVEFEYEDLKTFFIPRIMDVSFEIKCNEIVAQHYGNTNETSLVTEIAQGVSRNSNSKTKSTTKSITKSSKTRTKSRKSRKSNKTEYPESETQPRNQSETQPQTQTQSQPEPPETQNQSQSGGAGLNSIVSEYAQNKNPNSREFSKLSYYVIIDLSLVEKEGSQDKISLAVKLKLKCNSAYEKIRKSYADLFGLVYQPMEQVQPSIKNTKTDPNANTNSTTKNNTYKNKNKNQYNNNKNNKKRENNNNYTRRRYK